MHAKNFSFRVFAVIAALLPATALAANVLSLRGLPIQYMTDEDRDMLMAAVFGTLDRSPDGVTVLWENSKTGAHRELTPRASFDRAGQPCRELEVENSARGHDNRIVFTLCKQPGGEWKVEPQ